MFQSFKRIVTFKSYKASILTTEMIDLIKETWKMNIEKERFISFWSGAPGWEVSKQKKEKRDPQIPKNRTVSKEQYENGIPGVRETRDEHGNIVKIEND